MSAMPAMGVGPRAEPTLEQSATVPTLSWPFSARVSAVRQLFANGTGRLSSGFAALTGPGRYMSTTPTGASVVNGTTLPGASVAGGLASSSATASTTLFAMRRAIVSVGAKPRRQKSPAPAWEDWSGSTSPTLPCDQMSIGSPPYVARRARSAAGCSMALKSAESRMCPSGSDSGCMPKFPRIA